MSVRNHCIYTQIVWCDVTCVTVWRVTSNTYSTVRTITNMCLHYIWVEVPATCVHSSNGSCKVHAWLQQRTNVEPCRTYIELMSNSYQSHIKLTYASYQKHQFVDLYKKNSNIVYLTSSMNYLFDLWMCNERIVIGSGQTDRYYMYVTLYDVRVILWCTTFNLQLNRTTLYIS